MKADLTFNEIFSNEYLKRKAEQVVIDSVNQAQNAQEKHETAAGMLQILEHETLSNPPLPLIDFLYTNSLA